MQLSETDVRAVLRFVGDAYDNELPGGFRLRTLNHLRALVPSDMTAWVETRTGRPGVEVVASPRDPLPDGPRRFDRVRDEHPILAHFERSRHGSAAKLSDFFDRRRYHRLPIYQEFFRPAGVEHQISIALPSRGPRLVRITLNRGHGDFTERDRLVLNLVRAHVANAHRNAEARERLGSELGDLEQMAEAADAGVIVLGTSGRVDYASRRAQRQLAAYFLSPILRRRLPADLADWIGTHRSIPPTPLVVESDGGQLEIRSFQSGDRRRVLVLRERTTRIAPEQLESLGLTRRQADVLAWLAQGKANVEIAAILGISANTVARHVEAIFAKLGVHTRTAAAAAAFAHLAR